MLTENAYASVKLFHSSGAIVTIPLPSDGSSIDLPTASAISMSIHNLIQAGFVVTEADRANADEVEICAVLRGQLVNDRGTVDRIYMYAPRFKFKALTVYMDTAADIAKFEHYSGLKLADMPIIEGKAAPETDDPVFKNKSRAVNFKVLRKKEGGPNDDPKDAPWKLVRYVGAETPVVPTIVPKDAPDPRAVALRAAYERMKAHYKQPTEEARLGAFRNQIARLVDAGKIRSDETNADHIVAALDFDFKDFSTAVGK